MNAQLHAADCGDRVLYRCLLVAFHKESESQHLSLRPVGVAQIVFRAF